MVEIQISIILIGDQQQVEEVSTQITSALFQLLSLFISDVAIVDMSDISRQPSLFYHLGVRESFDMANNVILYYDTDADTALSLKVRNSVYCLPSCHTC